MEIILKEDLKNLGYKGEVVNVKSGYARNFLFPQGKAIQATQTNKKVLAEVVKQQAFKEEKLRTEAKNMAEVLKSAVLQIGAKVSTTGKIFGSVNSIQLAEAIKKKGYEIDKKKITLASDIKEIGHYTASVKLYKEIDVEISFEVIAE